MLDMGFLPDMRAILAGCAPAERRQTAMFSATWPMAIQKLAIEFLQNKPIKVGRSAQGGWAYGRPRTAGVGKAEGSKASVMMENTA